MIGNWGILYDMEAHGMLVLFTDTDTDITPEEAAEYGYKLISMPYSIDSDTVYPYEDFDSFDAHAFYEKLRNGVLPHTSAISKDRYVQYLSHLSRMEMIYSTFTFRELCQQPLMRWIRQYLSLRKDILSERYMR